MLDLDLNNISAVDLLANPRWYASVYTEDELLDALNLCTEKDEERKAAIYEILKAQGRIFNGDNILKFTLDGILDVFFSKYNSSLLLKEVVGEDARYCDIEPRFKIALLKFCTLVVNNKPLSDDIVSFANELDIDLNDTYFLNKLKNDLIASSGCFYDLDEEALVELDDYDKNNLLTYKAGFGDVIQRRLENVDRLIGKKIKSGCSAIGDTVSHNFFGDDVVEYQVGDLYIPIDNYCFVNIGSSCDLADHFVDVDFDEMIKNGDHFMVVEPTYKKNICSRDNQCYCRLVDIKSYNTGKIYTVSSW